MEEESRVNLQTVPEAQQAWQGEEEGDEGAGGHEDGGGVNGGDSTTLHPHRPHHLLPI